MSFTTLSDGKFLKGDPNTKRHEGFCEVNTIWARDGHGSGDVCA